jgi:hypothetical protein
MNTPTIAAFARFKLTLEAARDLQQPEGDACTSYHLQGLHAGLQIAIDGVAAEIRMLQDIQQPDHKESA